MDIEQLRSRIDSIDDQILNLLNRRAGMVLEIGRLKAQEHADIRVPNREEEIYQRLITQNLGPFPDEALVRVFGEIIAASRLLEVDPP